MKQLMILDEDNNIIGVCTDPENLPQVSSIYPGMDYTGIEVPHNDDLIDNFHTYYYKDGQFIKKHPVDYQITRNYIRKGQTTTILVPANTTAIIGDLEYEIEDGVIEYANPNTGMHSILLKAPNCLDTLVTIEVVDL